MATPVDMSLDDIIKKSKERGSRGRGRARRGRGLAVSFNGGRVPGAMRKGPLSVNARPSQYKISKPPRGIRNLPWQHDLLEDSIRAAGITGVEIGTKIYVSNLDYGVSNDDIRELFSEVGDLKRYAVHYDNTGRSSGSAEVVYTRRSDAFAALKKYNNVLLDGKPMKLEIVGATPAEVPPSARVNVTGVNGRRKRTVVMTPGQGRGRGLAPSNRGFGPSRRGGMRNAGRLRNGGGLRNEGGRGRGRGRGGGRGKKQPIEKSADQLDKELENYHAEAMQT
ncbi:THO complex subunit 4 [Euphorbia peplus]|nr:THO complex subunit 4 [Euphorbia peplus]